MVKRSALETRFKEKTRIKFGTGGFLIWQIRIPTEFLVKIQKILHMEQIQKSC